MLRQSQQRSRWTPAVAFLGTLVAAACSAPVVECVAAGSESQALTGGTGAAEYLGLQDSQELAIVRLDAGATDASGQSALCSGTLVAPDAILTAAHCLRPTTPDDGVEIQFQDRAGAPLETVRSRGWALHPTLDAALIHVDSELVGSGAVVPLSVALALPPELGVGSVVQLAGFGYTGNGSIGARRFAVSELAQIDDETLRVQAGGVSGACGGDSGGPTLVRGADGAVTVVGILLGGTVTCYGTDEYLRTDAIAGFLADVADMTAPDESGSTLGNEGRCFGQLAAWDEAGEPHSELCALPEACGWDTQAEGFRCVLPESDPCAGVSDLGRCATETVIICRAGTLDTESCGECGTQCLRSPQTGRVGCFRLEQSR